MKNRLIILLPCLLAAMSLSRAWAQDLDRYRLNLDLRQATFPEVLREIEAQTGLNFVYRTDLLPAERLDIVKRQASLPRVLDEILRPYGLSYEVRGRHLVLRRQPAVPTPTTPPPRGPGRLQGRVQGGDDGLALAGATIWVPEARRGAYAGPGGEFGLWLPPGPYQIEVRYLGYAPLEINLVIPPGGQLDTLLCLQPRTVALGDVLISANLEGQQRALSQQRVATQIQQVLSAELISRFPDLNVAEALQRMPGVQVGRGRGEGNSVQVRGTPRDYTLVQLEGETLIGAHEQGERGVDLDVIPVDQLATIELNKTLLPAMDGDALAGLVNMRLPRAGSLKPALKIEGGGGYTGQARGLSGIGKLMYKQRFLPGRDHPEGRLGLVVGGSFFGVENGRHRVETVWEARDPRNPADFADLPATQALVGQEPVFVGDEYILRLLDNQRYRAGGLAGLDWAWKTHQWSAQVLYSRRQDDDLRQRLRYRPGRGSWVTPFLSTGAEVRRDLNDRVSAKENLALILGGTHHWQRLSLRYQLFETTLVRNYEARRTLFRDLGHPLAFTPDPSGSWDIGIPGRDLHGQDLFYELRDITDDHIRNEARHRAARLDLEWQPLDQWQVQAGVKYRHLRQGQTRSNRFFDYTGPDTSMWAFGASESPFPFFRPSLRLGPFAAPAAIDAFFEAYQDDTAFFRFEPEVWHQVSDPVNRQGVEQTWAGYFQAQWQAGPWLLLTGLRQEWVSSRYTGNRVESGPDGDWIQTLPQAGSAQYSAWLPHLHLRYQWSPSWLVRAAAYQSYSRPNFLELTPYEERWQEELLVRRGNPALRPVRATHFELQAEHYWGNTGVAGLSLFGKRVSGFLLPVQQQVPAQTFWPGELGTATLLTTINGDQAFLAGLEVYGYLPLPQLAWAGGQWGILGNYTLARAAAREASESLPFPLQASHTGNLALTFDRGRLACRVNLNYTGRYLLAAGSSPATAVIRAPHHQVDLNASYRLSPRWSLFAEGLNLTDSPQIDYLGVRARPLLIEYYGWRARLGLAWTW